MGVQAFSLSDELKRLPAMAVGAALAGMATGFAMPFLAEAFINRVLAGGETAILPVLLLGVAGTAAVRTSLTWVQRELLVRHQAIRSGEAAERLARAVLKGDLAALRTLGAGDVANRLRLQTRAWRLFFGDLVHRFIELPALPLFFLLLVWFDPPIAALALVLTALNGAAVVLVNRRRRRIGDRLARARSRLAGHLVRDLDAMMVIKAGVLEDAVFSRWLWAHRRQRLASEQLGRLSEGLAVVPGLVNGVSLAVILGAGAWRIMGGELTVGGLVACQTLFFSINDVLRRFVEVGGQLEDVTADLRRSDILAALPEDPWLQARGRALSPARPKDGRVVAEGIPVGGVPLDHDFAAGSQTAVIGRSGCGKTRLCRVLAGLDTPGAGFVRIGGLDLQDLGLPTRAASVALVGRSLTSLSGPLREVVTLWDPTAEATDIWHALRMAAVADVVGRLPDGLDTVLGGQGMALSGGQSQRLAIAGALYRKPRVLVLDEGLEALDAGLAQRIVATLRQTGITGIVTTHRTDVVAACDGVLDLGQDRGR